MNKLAALFLTCSTFAMSVAEAAPNWAANIPLACVPSTNGTTYNVGPSAGQLPSIGSVPWENLVPGDTVRIFWRSTPYNEKFLINSTGGTALKPIRVCGVPDPATGSKPTIDGRNATTRATLAYRTTGQGAFIDLQNYALINIDGLNFSAPRPEYIILDNLHIKSATSPNTTPSTTFFSTTGQVRTYVEGVACIRLQKGAHIVIRNNEIEDCENGIFTQTAENWNDVTLTPDLKQVSEDVLLQSNYLYGHGGTGSALHHSSYTQSVGTVIEFNRYGPQRAGAGGSAAKDRSIGTVVRFNRFDSGGAREIDLVEAENNPHMALRDPNYRSTFVYGNIIRHDVTVGGAIHYGGDHYGGDAVQGGKSPPWTLSNEPWPSGAYGESFFRQGTLYFYNNTLIVDAAGQYGSSMIQIATTLERAELFNNVFWVTGNPIYKGMLSGTSGLGVFWAQGGTVNFGKNVYITGWLTDPDPDHPSGAIVSGKNNVLTTATTPVDLTSYQLVSGSIAIDASQQISTFPALSAYPLDREFTIDLAGKARVQTGSGLDLGALEFVPAPAFTSPSSLAGLTLNVLAVPFNITATGSPSPTITMTSGALPTGMAFTSGGANSGTASLTGTPTQAGLFNVTFTATGTPPAATQQLSLTVAKGSQSISFGALGVQLLTGSPLTISATATSGLSVGFTSTTTAVCTVSGTSVTLLAVGTCTLVAGQAGDANYLAASSVPQSFSVVSVPDAPTIISAFAGNGQISISFQPPTATGGTPLLSYTASCNGVTVTRNSSPITISGLMNGTTYTCFVFATNAQGAGIGSTSIMVAPSPVALSLIGVESRKNHGASGTIAVPVAMGIPANGAITVESRASGAAGHNVVFMFSEAIASAGSDRKSVV